MKDIKTLELVTTDVDDFQKVAREARKIVAGSNPNATLVAWWDSRTGEGAPREACSGETFRCVTNYAKGHGGHYHVTVNGGKLDLFYGVPRDDYQRLDPETGREIHREARWGEADNVQGG